MKNGRSNRKRLSEELQRRNGWMFSVHYNPGALFMYVMTMTIQANEQEW